MRVLLVSHVAPPHIGGVESVVWMEAQAFRDAGHEVVWVTSDGTGDGTPPEEGERLRIVRVKALHLLERWFGVAYPFFAPTLPFRLWREVARADLVHVHGLVFPGSPIAALFGRLRKKRVLCTDHGGLLQYRSRLATLALRALMETMGRVTARCAHKLIALNHDVEALLTRLSGRRDKVQFLPNPPPARRWAGTAGRACCASRACCHTRASTCCSAHGTRRSRSSFAAPVTTPCARTSGTAALSASRPGPTRRSVSSTTQPTRSRYRPTTRGSRSPSRKRLRAGCRC